MRSLLLLLLAATGLSVSAQESTSWYSAKEVRPKVWVISDQVKCVEGILDGTLDRKPYQSFAGNALIAVSGKASVAFNPDNL